MGRNEMSDLSLFCYIQVGQKRCLRGHIKNPRKFDRIDQNRYIISKNITKCYTNRSKSVRIYVEFCDLKSLFTTAIDKSWNICVHIWLLTTLRLNGRRAVITHKISK